MNSGRLCIGLDLGTSGMKGVALASDGAVAARAQAAYPTSRPVSRAAEQDTADWIQATEAVLQALAHQSDVADWLGIGLSGMLPTLVTLDSGAAANGAAVTWEDGRADLQGDRLRNSVGAEHIYRATGQWLDGRYLLPMFQRLAEEEPDRATNTAAICSAKDYLFSYLTGMLATDPSTAAGFGCYGLESGDWRPEVLAAADAQLPGGLPELPAVLAAKTTRPLKAGVASDLGVPEGLCVCLGAADSVLGALGLGVQSDGEVAYVAGTSSVILGVSSRLAFDPSHRYLVTPMAENGAWGFEMDLLATGSSLSWLSGVLLESRSPAAVGDMAADLAPEDAPVFLPYLGGGEQGALWNPDLRGSVIGLELRHDRGHIARALLNGIVLESRRCLAVLDEAGLPASTIHLAGGSAAVPGFAGELADATGRRVSVLADGDTDSSAAGAAELVARAVPPAGRAVPRTGPKAPTVIEPDKERTAVWDRLFARHNRALEAVKGFFEDPREKEQASEW
ncbi:MAG: FGGY family carbohydrate kinase [Acidimicrobiales bacterium]